MTFSFSIKESKTFTHKNRMDLHLLSLANLCSMGIHRFITINLLNFYPEQMALETTSSDFVSEKLKDWFNGLFRRCPHCLHRIFYSI